MSEVLLSLSQARLAFGHHQLLDGADLVLHSKDRIGLIGRNGSGKSSLLSVLAGEIALDDGELMRRSGLQIATLHQEPELPTDDTTVEDFLLAGMQAEEDWERLARAGSLMDSLKLQPKEHIGQLSGGKRKRVALAHALIGQPELLLLDEPSNHLDLDGIAWLENTLLAARISMVIITHDRQLLNALATRIVELDRGRLYSFPGGYREWQEQKEQWLEAEQKQHERFDKLLSQEEAWLRKGVKARRTRNEGRVRRLQALRRERAARRETQGQVRFSLSDGAQSGKLVAELDNITHGYDDRILIRQFSCVIQRGDRLGIIGPNGSGKTTLLRILLGELKPDSGRVRLGTRLTIGYFDQMRAFADESATLAETISPGSEWVEINGQRKHVYSYLEDFLFSTARSRSPIATLSGGERARLALARLFAQENNVLVLDEPTNDLDIDTLELLEDLLENYQGTVLLVSHDRAFLDNVVTQIIVAEDNGHWQEYVGGHADWLAAQDADSSRPQQDEAKASADSQKAASATDKLDVAEQKTKRQPRKRRLAPWEIEELEELPERISQLEAAQAKLAARLSDPELYTQGPEKAVEIQNQLTNDQATIDALYTRWNELEEIDSGAQSD